MNYYGNFSSESLKILKDLNEKLLEEENKDMINNEKILKLKQQILMNEFKEYIAKDPTKTIFVDMTALGLVELTRKKVRKTLAEQFYQA